MAAQYLIALTEVLMFIPSCGFSRINAEQSRHDIYPATAAVGAQSVAGRLVCKWHYDAAQKRLACTWHRVGAN